MISMYTWHMIQNGIKHLDHLMKCVSHFRSDFKKRMNGLKEKEQLKDGWRTLLTNYNVQEST